MTVRVRFAPSPTGELHIGSVRTTLYNFFFARQNGGQLILRIEDTDQERLDPRALDSIYDGLHWVGMRWDEGPREGGPHAPYVQSERLPLYRERAEELVAGGAAYYCFCSKERLEALRAEQAARKEITRYDRLCRRIEPGEARERKEREPHVVRLKVPDEGTVGIEDLVHGHVEWPLAAIEDQVVLKSDGYPTYHLAVVVDDHLMGITHILRGDEWLASVPKHMLIYRAFGWEAPPMGHVPLVLGPDGKKLSKRHGATRVAEFRDQGYLPEALVNFLSLIGWASGTEDEVFAAEELVRRWRIEQVQKGGARWDRERLNWFNGVWIRRLSPDQLHERMRAFLPPEWDDALVRSAVPLIQERLETLAQAPGLIAFLFTDEVAPDVAQIVPKKRQPPETADALRRSRDALAATDGFSAQRIEAALVRTAEDVGWSVRDLTIAVRVAVTGSRVGPPLYGSIELLGCERALRRLERAEAMLRS